VNRASRLWFEFMLTSKLAKILKKIGPGCRPELKEVLNRSTGITCEALSKLP
jgi:hypothetical protein